MSDDTKGILVAVLFTVLALAFVAFLIWADRKARAECLEMGGSISAWTTEEWSCSTDVNGYPQCGYETVEHWRCVDLPAEHP